MHAAPQQALGSNWVCARSHKAARNTDHRLTVVRCFAPSQGQKTSGTPDALQPANGPEPGARVNNWPTRARALVSNPNPNQTRPVRVAPDHLLCRVGLGHRHSWGRARKQAAGANKPVAGSVGPLTNTRQTNECRLSARTKLRHRHKFLPLSPGPNRAGALFAPLRGPRPARPCAELTRQN